MRESRIIKTYQILGIVIALASLTLSVGTLTTTYAYTGIATVSKEKYEVVIKDVTDVFHDGENVTIEKNPVVKQNAVSYGVAFGKLGEYTKFGFNIDNLGNVRAKVKEIVITGTQPYQENVEITIKGLEANQVILANASKKIEVVTMYKNPLYDEYGNVLPVTLGDIHIEVVLEKE